MNPPGDEQLPLVSIIIPAPPQQREIKALVSSQHFNYPADKIEIIVARGRQPSVQRNHALKTASGEFVYFLDDDSEAMPDNLRRAVDHFRADPKIAMVGGPNLCPPGAPEIEQLFALTMASWLAFGPSRARYTPVGKLRQTSEKELILCNLLGRREPLLQFGGFNELLYPNEENALMDQLIAAGNLLVYDPELIIYRRPRTNLRAFCRMLLNYGRGRAEQLRAHPGPGSLLNLVPPLFCLYLVALPFLPRFLWGLLLVYFLFVTAQAALLLKKRPLRWMLPLSSLIFLTHLLYGLGFWKGLFTRFRKPAEAGNITLEKHSAAKLQQS
jgi:glycosyltransferase involved in cell wall biosynthesis